MALPAGWAMLIGTDVTDADFNTSTYYINGTSIEFKATAVATAIISDFIEIPPGQNVEITIVARRTSGATQLNFGTYIYDNSQASLVTFVPSHSFTVANGTWEIFREVVSNFDVATRYMKIVIGKAAADSVQMFIGALDVRVCHRGFRVHKTSDQTITAAGGTQVVTWDVDDLNHGVLFAPGTDAWDPGTDGTAVGKRHHANFKSVWQFNANIFYNALPAAITAWIAFFKTGAIYSYGNYLKVGNAAADWALHHSDIVLLGEDDTLDVRTDHDSGSDQTLEGTDTGKCSFSGWELTP